MSRREGVVYTMHPLRTLSTDSRYSAEVLLRKYVDKRIHIVDYRLAPTFRSELYYPGVGMYLIGVNGNKRLLLEAWDFIDLCSWAYFAYVLDTNQQGEQCISTQQHSLMADQASVCSQTKETLLFGFDQPEQIKRRKRMRR